MENTLKLWEEINLYMLKQEAIKRIIQSRNWNNLGEDAFAYMINMALIIG